jgi:hypothetical protein
MVRILKIEERIVGPAGDRPEVLALMKAHIV